MRPYFHVAVRDTKSSIAVIEVLSDGSLLRVVLGVLWYEEKVIGSPIAGPVWFFGGSLLDCPCDLGRRCGGPPGGQLAARDRRGGVGVWEIAACDGGAGRLDFCSRGSGHALADAGSKRGGSHAE